MAKNGKYHGLSEGAKSLIGDQTPNNKKTTGRFRRTANELFGDKRRSELMPLSPADQAAYGLGKQALKLQFRTTRASLRNEAEMIREQYKLMRQGIRQQGEIALEDVDSGIAERGLVGASVQTAQQQAAKQATDQALSEAFLQRQQGLSAIKQQQLQALIDKRLGMSELQLQTAASRQQSALDIYGGPTRHASDYQLDTSGALGGANYVENIGKKGSLRRAVLTSTGVGDLFGNLEKVGFRIGETAWHNKGIDPTIHEGSMAQGGPSHHYSDPNETADINWAAGNGPTETRKLDKLEHLLNKFTPVGELIFGGNDYNPSSKDDEHLTHLHAFFDKKKWDAVKEFVPGMPTFEEHQGINKQLYQGFMDAGRKDLANMVGSRDMTAWILAETAGTYNPHIVSAANNQGMPNGGLFQIWYGHPWAQKFFDGNRFAPTAYRQAQMVARHFELTPHRIHDFARLIAEGKYHGWG